MRITSPVFENNQTVPMKYTCEGPNINPPLNFEDIPFETKSLVLIVEDPDAPAKPWVHWLVFNIPPTTTKVEEDSIPIGGTQGHANGGTFGYEGPCPPSNTHRYIFKLYAVDTILDIPQTSDRLIVLDNIKNHIIDKAELTGIYKLHK